MERAASSLPEYLQQTPPRPISPTWSLVYGIAALYLALVYFRCPLPAPQHLVWEALVYATPQRFLLSAAQRQDLRTKGMPAQTHAAKKEALCGMLGLGSATLWSKLPAGASEGIGRMRRASTSLFPRPQPQSDLPPGLGNWDNSCYQNVVLQGLASLVSLKPYLAYFGAGQEEKTKGSLLATIKRLQDPANNGQQLWTPAKLKSMSSWQQQDAQEYYSKILDEIDKETSEQEKAEGARKLPGLETLVHDVASSSNSVYGTVGANQSPLTGLLAQKVTCTRCGFSEGLSMIPFNCLTLPLEVACSVTDVQKCLDEYTKVEEIPEVECAKCTLVRAEEQLTKMLPTNPGFQSNDEPTAAQVDSKVLQLPPELRAQAFKRLAAVQKALEADDFADKTVEDTCQIGKKARVSSTKTKEIVIARSPRCLVVHVNRSVFDEQTGIQRKNYARVQYPLVFDLAPWMLNEAADGERVQDHGSLYRLKAVVTHYGRHENGHYICYRQHPSRRKESGVIEDDVNADTDEVDEEVSKLRKDPWYRLSDEDVSAIEEGTALNQGGVFMLFYEREPPLPLDDLPIIGSSEAVAGTHSSSPVRFETPADLASEPELVNADEEETLATTPSSSTDIDTPATNSPSRHPSTATTTEDELEPSELKEDEPRKSSSASPLLMRTARMPVIESEFGGNAFRAVAAT